ncbi:MAG TPA: hypothetical protein VFO89_10710, partial [Thermoanaerobaculia bacterium]|nr:hypothetical protein [Thermoanaerobaculia bacterium]
MPKLRRGSAAMPPGSLVAGFLAAGPIVGRLPYPMMPPGAQRVVRAALRHVWAGLDARAEQRLSSATEPEITTILQSALNQLLDDESEPVPGFSSSYFETVERGAEMVSYDGKHIEKRPDLRFRLQGRIPAVHDRTHYGLFAECKLLDTLPSLSLYASKGILRFVKGEYAWAMPHGMMVGYLRAGELTRADLVHFLNRRKTEYNVVIAAEAGENEEELV